MRVHPGDRIDGRYLVYEQTDENWGVCGWRARDEVLGRDILLTTFHPEDPRAESLVAAARSAARVNDHRFVRVLDAHIDQPTGFLVREWTGGQTLNDLLGNGPLTEDAAISIVKDVAEALQLAHDAGQQHLCVDPSTVVIDVDGAVRIRGLGTAAVLRGVQPGPEGAARDDAVGVGQVLYATLTGKLPAATAATLPVVRHSDEVVPAPRQVRAGVSPLLDAITVRALGSGRTHRFPPYASPGEVAHALTSVSPPTDSRVGSPMLATARPRADEDVVEHPPVVPPPHRRPALDPGPAAPPPRVPYPPDPRDEGEPTRRPGRWMRRAVIAAAVAIGVGIFLLGLELIAANRVPELDPADSPLATETDDPPVVVDSDPAVDEELIARPVVDTADYDPLGNGSENADRTGNAVDGDLATSWPTQTYFDPLELQKAGVGLLLDLGSPVPVQEVDLTLLGQPSDVEIRVAPEDQQGVPATPEGFIQLGRAQAAGTTVTVTGDARTTRYVLVWLTRLPQVDDGWRGGVTEVALRG